MKVIVTGSLGHISRPLAEELISKGHNVTIISSNAGKQKDIEALGATAAIGSVEDTEFLTRVFTGADVVYTMVPPRSYLDHDFDLTAYVQRVAESYATAISRSGVSRAIHLSSIGAHLDRGTGIIIAHHHLEQTLGALEAVDITFMRPTSFYYNLLGYIPQIKHAGFIAANYGGDDIVPWVSPLDIAAAIVEEIEGAPAHRRIRYVASEEATCTETAAVLGAEIGMPDLEWRLLSDEESLKGLLAAGLHPQRAAGLVEMYASLHSGKFLEDYRRHKPVMGKVKLAAYAKEFAAAFHQK